MDRCPLELANTVPVECEINKDYNIVVAGGLKLEKCSSAGSFCPFMAEPIIHQDWASMEVSIESAR